MVDNMDKICIDKIGCRYPYGFYACWMAIFLWISLSIYFDLVNSQFMTLLDLFGFVGFGAIFIFIAGSFGTVPGKKQFLCDVYDGLTGSFKKIILYELKILLLALALSIYVGILFIFPIDSIKVGNYSDLIIELMLLTLFLVLIYYSIRIARDISKLVLKKYVGRIVTLCTDIILLPNLFVLTVLSRSHDLVKLLIVCLVYHFLYTLIKIVRLK